MVIRGALFFILALAVATSASGSQCLRYEPTVVGLSGTVKRVVFPGPPNYEDIKKGDQPEPYWVLYLENPICVIADPKDEINETESNILSLQLILDSYARYKELLGSRVVVTGRLTHSISGHHHTKVLMEVQEMRSVPNNSLQPTSALTRRRG